MIRVAPRPHEQVLQAVEQQSPVGQSSQGIVEEIVFQLLFRALAFSDVAIHDDQFRDLPFVVANRARHGLQYAPAGIFVLDAVLQPFPDASLACFSGRIENPEAIVGMNLFKRGSLA